MKEILTLLIALNICHWLADYTHLSTNWMLSAKRIGSPFFPIFCHALVHAALMGIVLWLFVTYVTNIIALPLNMELTIISFQIITHFAIDVLKGKLNVWFPKLANPANKYHWYIFGADQLLHQVVIITMVWILIIS